MFQFVFAYYFIATMAYMVAHYFLTRRSKDLDEVKKEFFEIHVLINPKKYQVLSTWLNSNKKRLIDQGFLNVRYMATRTSTGVSRVQPMVTCLVRVKNHRESIEWTQKLTQIVKDALKSEASINRSKSEGLVDRSKSEGLVDRSKSEGLVDRSKSEGLVDRSKSEGLVDRSKSEGLVHSSESEDVVGGKPHRVRRVFGTGYFESHCKVPRINTVEDWRKFAKLCASSVWTDRKISVPLLSNFDSAKGPHPVTTLRMYETDLETFLQEHDKFIAFLKDQGYHIMNPHIEESQYDNNPFTDLDWAIFPRYPDAYKDYVLGKSFNECFRWCEPQDFTEEAYNPPEGWLEQVTAFENA